MSTETLYPGQKDLDMEQLPQGQPVPLHILFNASFICFSNNGNNLMIKLGYFFFHFQMILELVKFLVCSIWHKIDI